MNTVPDQLFLALEHQLNDLHLEIEDPLLNSRKAVAVIMPILEKLKTWCVKYEFTNSKDEIAFFRNSKPRFTAQLIYYNSIYNLENSKPLLNKCRRKYYVEERTKIKYFFRENATFYSYYRSGSDYLDEKYFLRGQYDLRLALDNVYFQSDHSFSTSHDYKVAQIIANEMMLSHLESTIEKLNPGKVKSHERPLKWTGSKVGIIELIYALHTEGVFNHGACELKDLANYFSKTFDIDLTQYHRTFFEISSRKSDRTKFLRSLNDNLIRRMDDSDKY